MIQHHANIIPYGLSLRCLDTYNTTKGSIQSTHNFKQLYT